jgi:hypothetical protein
VPQGKGTAAANPLGHVHCLRLPYGRLGSTLLPLRQAGRQDEAHGTLLLLLLLLMARLTARQKLLMLQSTPAAVQLHP